MQKFKKLMDVYGPDLIEKLGIFINPIILNIKKEPQHLLVFYFHGIFESEKQKKINHIDPQNNMTVRQFMDFIDYFQSHNYKFILPQDLNTLHENKQPYAMLTFDDGYFNNQLAIEVLNRYKIPAVFFLSTKNIIENKSYWWDIIYKYRAKQAISFENIRREQNLLKSFKHTQIDNYIIENFGIKSFKPWSDLDRPFSEEEIKELSTNPYISFGNHTHNHSILTNYRKEEIKEELSISNKIIFELTGTLPISIAFPNGNYNQLVLATTKEEGFQYAFTTETRPNSFPIRSNDLTNLSRYMTSETKINKFGGFCRLGYDPNSLYNNLLMNTKQFLGLKNKVV